MDQDFERLVNGNAPEGEYEIGELSEKIDFLSDFIAQRYLDEYILHGGSKMKFITGRRGSGKTHIVNLLRIIANKKSYVTVGFSANDIWLHDFKEVYLEILNQCDIMSVLSDCANVIIREMGYAPEEISDEGTFMDYLSSIGEADAITKRELRLQLKKMFLDNNMLDNNFALACSLLTGSILGHPILESSNQEILLNWLRCDKSVRLLHIRALGLAPTRINKFNARNMLRSLAVLIHDAGHSGLFVTVDDMEILLSRSSMAPKRYTKMRRDDTYESIRQMIDEIDSMKNIMFVFSFDRSLMDDERFGLKSYQALWMRIQNEVTGSRFNRFSDIIDLDRLGGELYDRNSIRRMAEKLVQLATDHGLSAELPSWEDIDEILHKSKVGSYGIPLMVNRRVFKKEEEPIGTDL